METNDQYLIHYGVLGMRWGVRKDRKAALKSSKQQYKSDVKKIKSQNISGDKKKQLKAKAKQDRYERDVKADAKAFKENYGSKDIAQLKLNSKATIERVKKVGQNVLMGLTPLLTTWGFSELGKGVGQNYLNKDDVKLKLDLLKITNPEEVEQYKNHIISFASSDMVSAAAPVIAACGGLAIAGIAYNTYKKRKNEKKIDDTIKTLNKKKIGAKSSKL